MKGDKNLQSMLKSYGMQETSADFDDKLMQKIAAINLHKSTAKPILNQTLLRILVIVFIVIAATLLAFTFSIQPDIFSKYFSVAIPQKMYVQIFSFFAAFWIVMCFNLWWNNKKIVSFF